MWGKVDKLNAYGREARITPTYVGKSENDNDSEFED